MRNYFVLLLGMLGCGFLSVFMGKELTWDLANYHYYNPFVFFNSRNDFWPPSFLHQYINPVSDFLSYFLINHFSSWLTVFILGSIHGINFFLIFYLATQLISDRFKLSIAFLMALLGMYGPTALPGIGSFQNDNMISIFVLASIILQIKAIKIIIHSATVPKCLLFLSGVVLGLGCGLKFTAGIFVIGLLVASFFLPLGMFNKVKFFLLWCIAVFFGIAITGGYWMHVMWLQHHNPVFPFLNGLFHSPDFQVMNWHDKRFLPQNWLQTIFYPFYFSFDGRTSDTPFRDFRFIFVYILVIFAGCKWIMHFLSAKKVFPDVLLYWFFIFFIASYLVWQIAFSIARYLNPLEMLAPLMIYFLVITIFDKLSIRLAFLTLFFYSLCFFLIPTPMPRATWYEKSFFNIQLPNFVHQIKQAKVIMAYSMLYKNPNPRPQSYLIPFFPSEWIFIGVPIGSNNNELDEKSQQKIRNLILSDTKPIYLLTSDFNMPDLFARVKIFGLRPTGDCAKIFSDRQKITNQDVLLCQVK